jgi:hypothetical protein
MLENDLGELSPEHKRLASVLELVRIESFIPCTLWNDGRKPQDRRQIARAFVAKVVFKIAYTKQLINLLKTDKQLKAICGWNPSETIPHESKFSRAFSYFSKIQLPEKVHQALVKETYKDQVVGHVVKDSAPLEAREKPAKKKKQKRTRKRKV